MCGIFVIFRNDYLPQVLLIYVWFTEVATANPATCLYEDLRVPTGTLFLEGETIVSVLLFYRKNEILQQGDGTNIDGWVDMGQTGWLANGMACCLVDR